MLNMSPTMSSSTIILGINSSSTDVISNDYGDDVINGIIGEVDDTSTGVGLMTINGASLRTGIYA